MNEFLILGLFNYDFGSKVQNFTVFVSKIRKMLLIWDK